MNVHAVIPNVDTRPLLAAAQFVDAYSVEIDNAGLDARDAAEKMLARGPRWIDALISLRNHLVKPFGLKTPAAHGATSIDSIGIFPVVSETPSRLVTGFDDHHLDFRVVIDVASSGRGQQVTLTTLVLTHNLLGRVYLTIILPFHRLIARAMLRQVAS